MKKMTSKELQSAILITSSFLIGCIIGVLLMCIILPKESKNDLSNTIQRVEDAVVSIESMEDTTVDSTGSGFVYKKGLKKAYILTNEHVIDSGNIRITNSKGEMTEGIVLGKDESLDLAVIEIESKYAPKTVQLGDSSKVKVGEEIFVISSPISKKYAGSVTKGIISGTGRTVPTDLSNDEETLFDGLQFDASVNPGSSGGPLFNQKGEVIGICIMKFIQTEIEGMGFAIPINQAKTNLMRLEKGEEIEKPELGIMMVDVTNTSELNNYNIKLDKNYKEGIIVLEVKEGSNADKKILKGDIITQIDKTTIRETDDVKKELLRHQIGDTIQVKLIRNKKEKSIKIKLK